MKLNQMIDLTNWKLIGGGGTVFEAKYDVVRQAILTQLFYTHGEREVRTTFDEGQMIIDYVRAFMMSNKQKFIYIFTTSQEDFLSQDNTSTTNSTDESNAFNTDYYGGSGQTGKDTATGDTTTTNKSINNKDKSKNFYDVADNYLFRQMMNTICETFTIDEEIRW